MRKTPIRAEVEPYTDLPNLDFYVRNGLLFGIYEEKPHAFIRENPDSDMLNALSHLGGRFPLAILDESSYEALKTAFLELKSEEGIGGVE
ncbi:MAG: hypothetical protein L3J42_07040, partial [Hydrogenimonas sp.]|nr:hypothetical protein [Hydrogenimonas sp.]